MKNTCTFKSLMATSQDLLIGMQLTKKEMIEKDLWHDKITFEEWANYAGRHVIIKESE